MINAQKCKIALNSFYCFWHCLVIITIFLMLCGLQSITGLSLEPTAAPMNISVIATSSQTIKVFWKVIATVMHQSASVLNSIFIYN